MGRKTKDLTGQRFGRLVVVELGVSRNDHATWRCLCDCGKYTTVQAVHLVGKHTTSCGCLCREIHRERGIKQNESGELHQISLTGCVENTRLGNLMAKLSKNNTSGHKGVSPHQGKWVAIIYFQGVKRYLGIYDTIEEAVAARQNAEDLYFAPVLERHKDEVRTT